MTSCEAINGFSGIFAVLGNNANSDSGLAAIYETKDAEGVCPSTFNHRTRYQRADLRLKFFESRCRTNIDGALTHLKAHV